ncbi:PLP-dependent aminotransferase family protein (plasmid) [Rhizobium grahamii]|uniref:PLP-dependent aminotransferase family protein n=1 Tax=Rhizobium grahamii TaxID=1120045 RepID=A0A5Q0CBT7_9HYPH|nr:PLP-dependent aminotransferase family protein [Rhizobium grahamii]QRM51889.1 PLP-dependent aminotransferase family protein [Rhizobium sp. BG6]
MAGAFLPLVNREHKVSITQQIFLGMRTAILSGTLEKGSRLSSWQDLSVQLGVSRGTVKRAYDLLKDHGFIVTKGRGGTWVAMALPVGPVETPPQVHAPRGLFYDFEEGPQYFQLGVPAQDQFPSKAWHGAWRRAIATEGARPQIYPDPRGLLSLRREVAGYLATARGYSCHPSQVFITSGFAGALGIVLGAMGFRGNRAFVEDPGFPRTRHALQQAGVETIAAPVDREGVRLPIGEEGARLAVITPGQQAPLGMSLSATRRAEILHWASEADAWIIEDDYAGELQLSGRALPALAADDRFGRVFHIGSFSKTLNPGLRLGFLVVPLALADMFGAFVGHLAPAGSVVAQQAVQNFMSGGHFYRHLRRMKALYARRKALLVENLCREIHPGVRCEYEGALSVRLFFPKSADDVAIAAEAQRAGLGVLPLSPWYQSHGPGKGLLLGIANVRDRTVRGKCETLSQVISSHPYA